MREIDRVTARVVAARDQAIPVDDIHDWGDPLLLDVINERWQKVGRGVTVEVLLESQDTVDAETQLWREVANILSDRLLSIGTSFGLYLYNDDRR